MEQAETSGIHPNDYITILKRRWLIATVSFLTVFSAASYATWKLPPIYQATTKVTFQPTPTKLVLPEQASPYESVLLHNLSFETQVHIIGTNPVLRRIAEHLEMLNENMTAGEEEDVLGSIRNSLVVERIRDTSILMIRAQHTDPMMTARLANAAADVYVEINREREMDAVRRSSVWLTQTLLDVTQKLESAETAWITYARSNNLPLDTVASPTTSVPQTARQLSMIRAEIDEKKAQLATLRKTFRPQHPRIVGLEREITALQSTISTQQGQLLQNNGEFLELSALRSKADVTRGLRDLLVRRMTETHLTGASADSTIEIIEAARVPRAPVRPHRARNVGLGAGASLFLALAFAFLAEYMDRSVKSPEEVEQLLELPTLAVLGRLRGPKRSSPVPFLLGSEKDYRRESEAFRTLRTNLRFSYAGEERKLLLVTSGGPGEGKTTVAMNLGLAISQTGQRVLIVDADFRQPALHRVFQLKSNVGIADVLTGDVQVEQAVVPVHPGVDVLPRGTRPPNPAELLDSRRMRELLALLRANYDCVILDSPPVGTVVDPTVLASQVEGIVMVIESGRFRPDHLVRFVKRIERVGGKIYGVVMNKMQAGDSAYGDYYYYYSQYYSDEPTTGAEAGNANG